MKTFDRYFNGMVPVRPYDFKNKDHALNYRINYMLARLRSMFKYEGLPETIPERMIELYLLSIGHCVVTEVNGSLYAFFGGWGGELDEYYRPTIYTVDNPYLNFYKNLKINDDCILCGNDSAYQGLMPMLRQYSTAMVENELSMQIADINSRIVSLITADDDTGKESAEIYLKNIIKGDLGVIAESAFLDGVETQPYASEGANRLLTDLIEYEQYLKASLFNEIGLNANYNMKRESLNSSESQLNNDALTPLIDDMLKMRQDFCSKINEKYGTNITVNFASAWEENEQETEAELDALEAESEQETETENVSRETLTEEQEEGAEDEREKETD